MSFKIDTNFEGKLTCASKNDMKFSPEHLKVSKLGPWWQPFVYSMSCMSWVYEFKIYGRVMCHDNEKWCKIFKKIDLSVQNWHE